MAANIEIKARISDPGLITEKVEALCDSFEGAISQEDIFFNTAEGRLKLRVLAEDRGQLIYYERPDTTGPKLSEYHISETKEPANLQDVLDRALGVRGIVRKTRQVYWSGQTRIHLDQVDNLGAFLELEVVMDPDQRPQEGEAIAVAIMAELQISQDDLVKGAYIDLLEAGR